MMSRDDRPTLKDRVTEWYCKRELKSRKELRESLDRYFSSGQANAIQVALTGYRYRFKNEHGDSNQQRIHRLALISDRLKTYFNPLEWDTFAEALVLFEIHKNISHREDSENIYDSSLSSAGVSKQAIKLINFMHQGRTEPNAKYFSRINKCFTAKLLLLATLAHDLRNVEKLGQLDYRRGSLVKAQFTLSHLDITPDLWGIFETMQFHAEFQASKMSDESKKTTNRMTMEFQDTTGEADSELATMFAKLQLVPTQNKHLIQHDKETCGKCFSSKETFNGDFQGHKVLVSGRVAQAIAMQTSFYWSDPALLDDSHVLKNQFRKGLFVPEDVVWYSLEFHED